MAKGPKATKSRTLKSAYNKVPKNSFRNHPQRGHRR